MQQRASFNSYPPPSTLPWLTLLCTPWTDPTRRTLLVQRETPALRSKHNSAVDGLFVLTAERLCLCGASVRPDPKISTWWYSYPDIPLLGKPWSRIEKCDFGFHRINLGLNFMTFTRRGGLKTTEGKVSNKPRQIRAFFWCHTNFKVFTPKHSFKKIK